MATLTNKGRVSVREFSTGTLFNTALTNGEIPSACLCLVRDTGKIYSASGNTKHEFCFNSDSCTGNAATATSALKLSNTAAIGGPTQPVYFSAAGVPVAGSYTLGAACAKSVKTLSSPSNLGWTNQTDGDNSLVTKACMSFWNGAYSGSSSNLAYCVKGAFGDMATKTASSYSLANHSHLYAGSSATGGAATSALKLSNTAAIGGPTQPVYFSANGVPVAGSYTLGAACAKSVKTLSSTNNLGWTDQADGDNSLVTKACIARWNGAYSGSSSNLAYCVKGAFGDMATKTASSYSLANHSHLYAGSSAAGGAATSALKLSNTAAIGGPTQPVYFSANGVPSLCSFTVGKSVPNTAVFTDSNVLQSSSSTESDFPLLLKYTANSTNQTGSVKFATDITANPYRGELTAKFNGQSFRPLTCSGITTTYKTIKLSDLYEDFDTDPTGGSGNRITLHEGQPFTIYTSAAIASNSSGQSFVADVITEEGNTITNQQIILGSSTGNITSAIAAGSVYAYILVWIGSSKYRALRV